MSMDSEACWAHIYPHCEEEKNIEGNILEKGQAAWFRWRKSRYKGALVRGNSSRSAVTLSGFCPVTETFYSLTTSKALPVHVCPQASCFKKTGHSLRPPPPPPHSLSLHRKVIPPPIVSFRWFPRVAVKSYSCAQIRPNLRPRHFSVLPLFLCVREIKKNRVSFRRKVRFSSPPMALEEFTGGFATPVVLRCHTGRWNLRRHRVTVTFFDKNARFHYLSLFQTFNLTIFLQAIRTSARCFSGLAETASYRTFVLFKGFSFSLLFFFKLSVIVCLCSRWIEIKYKLATGCSHHSRTQTWLIRRLLITID